MADGLLDFLKSPEGQGLLSAAFGGLAYSRSDTPWNNLGRAGMAGLMGYSGAQERQAQLSQAEQQKRLREMQIAEMLRQQEKQRFMEENAAKFATPATPGYGAQHANIDAMLPPEMRTGLPNTPASMTVDAKPAGFDMGGYMSSIMSKYPLEAIRMQQEARKADQVTLGEGQNVYSASTGKPVFQTPQKSTDDLREYNFAVSQGYKGIFPEFKKEIASAGSPFFSAIPTEKGYMSFSGRTGDWRPLQAEGAPVLPAAQSPNIQGQITTSKETAEAGVKNKEAAKAAVSKSDIMLQQIREAEQLLARGPTASGIGAGVDYLGRTVGMTSKSAQTAAQLKAVSGWLTSNVPRMEGPQSNYDVKVYQQMAAMVGDETRPVQERMAALTTVKSLQEKYRQFNQDKIEPAQKQNTRKDVSIFDAADAILQGR